MTKIGIISYPRTETESYPPGFDLRGIIELQQSHNDWGNYAKKLLEGAFREPRKGPNNDQAHPPIHPTKFVNNLVGDEKLIYEFVVRHYLASCSDGNKLTLLSFFFCVYFNFLSFFLYYLFEFKTLLVQRQLPLLISETKHLNVQESLS